MSMLGKVKEAVRAETEAEPPKSFLDKIINTTPVVMTVVATILAGLSSSEMSTAQYHRSMASQNQSKAGDQWGLYQAKRIRQANAENALDVLQNAGTGTELSPASLQKNAADLANAGMVFDAASGIVGSREAFLQRDSNEAKSLSEKWNQAIADPAVVNAIHYLAGSELPAVSEKKLDDPDVQAALDAIKDEKPDRQTSVPIRKVDEKKFNEAMAAAQANEQAFEAATKPMQQAIDRVGKLVGLQAVLARRIRREVSAAPSSTTAPGAAATQSSGDPADWRNLAATLGQQTDDLAGDFAAARLRYTARRYTAESSYNMAIAQLYELDVHRSGSASDRHRDRSRDFFYGMLGAQAAVTIATLSLAVKNRSILWTFATVAGAMAVGSGVYVYLFT